MNHGSLVFVFQRIVHLQGTQEMFTRGLCLLLRERRIALRCARAQTHNDVRGGELRVRCVPNDGVATYRLLTKKKKKF